MTARTQKPQWESEPWLEEPGANSPALEPAGKGIYGSVIKTMPEIGLRTLAGELPALEEDISNKNEIYLEINGGWIQYRWLLILASPFFFGHVARVDNIDWMDGCRNAWLGAGFFYFIWVFFNCS